MPSAEILTIGTELLLGEIVDTNAAHVARVLRTVGIDVRRKVTVGDNIERIAEAVQDGLSRSDFVITTGGLGPTVDDMTRDAVAAALGVDTEFQPELWEQVQDRFRRFGREPTDNNRRQAYVPVGATPITNPVGTAPAFVVDSGQGIVFVLPGVPREMKHLLKREVVPYLQKRFGITGTIVVRLLHTTGAGESHVDAVITDLQTTANPTVGLAAHPGQVDVRITAKAQSEGEARELIVPIEAEIRRRLGTWVYGADGGSLESTVLAALKNRGWRLVVVEGALGGRLIRRLSSPNGPLQAGVALSEAPDRAEVRRLIGTARAAHGLEVALGVALYADGEATTAYVLLTTPEGDSQREVSFGGHPKHGPARAVNLALDVLRGVLNDSDGTKSGSAGS